MQKKKKCIRKVRVFQNAKENFLENWKLYANQGFKSRGQWKYYENIANISLSTDIL